MSDFTINGVGYSYGEIIRINGIYPFAIAAPSTEQHEVQEPKERTLSDKTLNKLYNEFADMIANFNDEIVMYFSSGNSKTHTLSISLVSLLSCGDAAMFCGHKCYSCRGCASYRKSYNYRNVSNQIAYMLDPEKYELTLHAVLKWLNPAYFRYNVDGDIAVKGYYGLIARTAISCPDCNFLLFTKQYDEVNTYCRNIAKPSNNLHIEFSRWPGLPCDNPFNFAETHINFKNGGLLTVDLSYTDPAKVTFCKGDCLYCQNNGIGCFHAVNGDITIINQH